MSDAAQTPAQWLAKQFENTVRDRMSPGQRRSVIIQPIYQLKNHLDAGQPMRIGPAEYRDPMRWPL
jgi:hypothetical protein